jgi:hypothetical protein
MLDELLPTVRVIFENIRSLSPKLSPTAVVRRAHFNVDDMDAMFEYSWERSDGKVGITIWLEDAYQVGEGGWLLVDSLDTKRRRGGGERAPEQVRRADRRLRNLRNAYQAQEEMIGFLQTNRVPIIEMEKNRSAKVDVRVRDLEGWFVHEIRPDLDRMVLKRGLAWTPSEADIVAATRWRRARDEGEPAASACVGSSAYDPMTAPILYVNMAWMKEYRGHTAEDPVHGGNFSWLKREGRSSADAHEQFNFLPLEGRVFAYVPGSPTPNINKLGAKSSQKEVGGVLVAFMARDPGDGATKIVGCFHNATVYRGMEFIQRRAGIDVQSPISASSSNAVVLPISVRSVVVPHWRRAESAGGGYGQSALWYGAEEVDHSVRQLLAKTSKTGGFERRRTPKRGPRQPDVAKRLAVEAAAMKAALEYFDGARDVSEECYGWDLEADGLDSDILIEVKGLSGSDVNVELTPNEYDKMWLYRDRFILFVLTNALGPSPRISIFRHQPDGESRGVWVSATGEHLNVFEMVSARCSV